MIIRGNTAGSYAPRADYAETDPKSPSYIKNKPNYDNVMWPIENGGHGGKTREDGFTNLAFIGNDPVSEATDSPSSWLALGNGFAGLTTLCTVKQPNRYGTIINMIVNNFNVHQIFIGADADLSFRCGSKNQGWIFNWRSVLTKAGGEMTGPVTLNGIHLTPGVDYGKEFPADAKEGRLFFMEVVTDDG